MNNKKSFFTDIRAGILWLTSLTVIVPFYMIIVNSLKTSAEANLLTIWLPKDLQWGNYISVIETAHLLRAFFNSLLISSVSVTLCLFVTSMGAFILSRDRTHVNKLIYNYFFFGLIAPLNYVTTIWVLKFFHLQGTYAGIILVYAALGIPFAMFIFYGFVNGIPRELDEAAIIDGCGTNRLFFSVIFPLLKPVTITALVLNFLGAWNDFVTPLYLLNSSEKLGMVNSIYNFFGAHFNEWNMIFANIIMSVIPITVLYLFGQRYIVSGMATGAVKG